MFKKKTKSRCSVQPDWKFGSVGAQSLGTIARFDASRSFVNLTINLCAKLTPEQQEQLKADTSSPGIINDIVVPQVEECKELAEYHRLAQQLDQARKDTRDSMEELSRLEKARNCAVVNDEPTERLEIEVDDARERVRRFRERCEILRTKLAEAKGAVRRLTARLLDDELRAEKSALRAQLDQTEAELLDVASDALNRLAEIRIRQQGCRWESKHFVGRILAALSVTEAE